MDNRRSALQTIDRASWILLALAATLLVALWALFNRPDHAPPWPQSIEGVSFSPFRAGQTPKSVDFYPSEEQISRDLALLAGSVESVRTYSVEGTLGSVPRLAREHGLRTTVGLWISDDLERNRREIDELVRRLPEFRAAVEAVVVGNETLLRGELTLLRACRAAAALGGEASVSARHIAAVAPMALRHRLRRDPLDDSGTNVRVTRALDTLGLAA